MNFLDIASSAASSFVKKKNSSFAKGETPDIPAAKPIILKNSGDKYFVGYASCNVMPEDLCQKSYWMAGYSIGNKIKGVLDELTISAMYLDTPGGEGIVYVCCDLIGMTRADVNTIRHSLDSFCEKCGCKFIMISCSHTHAGIDTVGYWGQLPKSGRNPKYMTLIGGAIKYVCFSAYKNRKEGTLYRGDVHAPEYISDWREPYFLDDRLTRIRFVPDDGSAETWLINYSAHPNTLGGKNNLVSADYPGFMRERIKESEDVNVLFTAGAIGSIDLKFEGAEDNLDRATKGGRALGELAIAITNDEKLSGNITIINQEFIYPGDNTVLCLMDSLGVIKTVKCPCDSDSGIALISEMTYVNIGTFNMLAVPGEIFPELVWEGGYADAEHSTTGDGPEINPIPLSKILGDDRLVIFGVTDDMTGYVVAPNDFILHPTQPYLSRCKDRFGRGHYQETNSLGPRSAFAYSDACKVIADTIKNINKE